MAQGSPKTLRIAKIAAAAITAAVAMKKAQRLPCPKGQSRPTTCERITVNSDPINDSWIQVNGP